MCCFTCNTRDWMLLALVPDLNFFMQKKVYRKNERIRIFIQI